MQTAKIMSGKFWPQIDLDQSWNFICILQNKDTYSNIIGTITVEDLFIKRSVYDWFKGSNPIGVLNR